MPDRALQHAAMLRHRADWRTLLWAFVLFPVSALAPYYQPRLIGWLLPWGLYMGFCAGVFSHNHNHSPTFKNKRANAWFSAWLSFFYGYPTFGWIPTHNKNHHKFTNARGDHTATWRHTNKHTFLVAVSYFFYSASWQAPAIKEFIRDARGKTNGMFGQIVGQYAVVAGGHVSALALGIYMLGPAKGTLAYLTGFGLPAFFALWSMMFINYIQHVHCDPTSKRNHSRNFVSGLGNFLVFNNGFHTVHHDNAGTHWSLAPAAHAKIAAEIDPSLNQSSIFGFCIRQYLFGLFSEKYRTKQIGQDPSVQEAAAPSFDAAEAAD
jgi:fatty acid desaturase